MKTVAHIGAFDKWPRIQAGTVARRGTRGWMSQERHYRELLFFSINHLIVLYKEQSKTWTRLDLWLQSPFAPINISVEFTVI